MLRVTDDVLELRRWADTRGARPCRDQASGRPGLVFPGTPCPAAQEVGWDEWEATFRHARSVFVYDDAPGGRRWLVGDLAAARRFVTEAERAHGGLAVP
jgi:hypothetical protein